MFAVTTSVGSAAAEEIPVEIAFVAPATVSIEYGQFWQLSMDGSENSSYAYSAGAMRVEIDGVPAGYTPYFYVDTSYGPGRGDGYLSTSGVALPAGNYPVRVVADFTPWESQHYYGVTPEASVTVKPAALGVELRVLSDESNPARAIISARLTGRFVDEYYPDYSTAPPPTGTWTITVTDSDQKTVEEFTADQDAGDGEFAVSHYWSEAVPGQNYAVAAAFAPTGTSSSNFAVADPAPFNYTASDASRSFEESAAPETSSTTLPPEPDFSVPLWWAILIGVAVTALIAFAITFAVRLANSPTRRATVSEAAPISEVSQS